MSSRSALFFFMALAKYIDIAYMIKHINPSVLCQAPEDDDDGDSSEDEEDQERKRKESSKALQERLKKESDKYC